MRKKNILVHLSFPLLINILVLGQTTAPNCNWYPNQMRILNSEWNWDGEGIDDGKYIDWYARVDGVDTPRQLISPFISPTGPLVGLDFSRSQGWVLIDRDFGQCGPVPYPHFILYNKYTSILRIFVYFSSTGAANKGYNKLYLELTKGENQVANTAITSGVSSPNKAPDKYFNNSKNKIITDNSTNTAISTVIDEPTAAGWQFADFAVSYDPYISEIFGLGNLHPYYKASLNIKMSGLTKSELKASITGSSTTQDLEIAQNQNYVGAAPEHNNQVGTTLKKVEGFIGKLAKTSKGIEEARKTGNEFAVAGIKRMVDLASKKVINGTEFAAYNAFKSLKKATDDKGGFWKSFGVVSKALSFAGPLVGAVGGIIGLFASDEPEAPAAPAPSRPTITEYNLQVSGSIETTTPLANFSFNVPGVQYDKATPEKNSLPTHYNCPLGFFNIMNTPQIEFVQYNRVVNYTTGKFFPDYYSQLEDLGYSCNGFASYKSYNIKNDIGYGLNESSGLELVAVTAALIAENSGQDIFYNDSENMFGFVEIEWCGNDYCVGGIGINKDNTCFSGDWRFNNRGGQHEIRYHVFEPTLHSFNPINREIELGRMELHRYDLNGKHQIGTPFVALEKLKGMTLTVPEHMKVYVRVIAILKVKGSSNDSAPIYFSKDYDPDFTQSPTIASGYYANSFFDLPPFANHTSQYTTYNQNLEINDQIYPKVTSEPVTETQYNNCSESSCDEIQVELGRTNFSPVPSFLSVSNKITATNTKVIATPCYIDYYNGNTCNTTSINDLHLTAFEIELGEGFEVEEGADFTAISTDYGYKLPEDSPVQKQIYVSSNCYNINAYRMEVPEHEISNMLPALSEDDFMVYPNPTQTGSFTIKTNSKLPLQIIVTDMLGRIVLKTITTGFETLVQLENTVKGVFQVSSQDHTTSKHKKLIVE